MAIIALIFIGFLYFYNNPRTVYKQHPVYYPVYETEYVPVRPRNVFRPRPFPRNIHHKHRHNNFPSGVRFDKDNKPIPGSGGGGV